MLFINHNYCNRVSRWYINNRVKQTRLHHVVFYLLFLQVCQMANVWLDFIVKAFTVRELQSNHVAGFDGIFILMVFYSDVAISAT